MTDNITNKILKKFLKNSEIWGFVNVSTSLSRRLS